MKIKVCIVGIEGNMGQRYMRGCDYLKIDCNGFDKKGPVKNMLKEASHFIISTPTETHIPMIEMLAPYKKPILCEKPVVKDTVTLFQLKQFVETEKVKLFMVNQYAYFKKEKKGESSYYNYYNTGKDGLYWDCIQIIHLAKSSCKIENTSPIWQCQINGMEYPRSVMDLLYLLMLQDFVGKQTNLWGWDDIEKATLKVIKYEKDINSDPST